MDSRQIRSVFLNYFKSKGYVEDSSASLVPAGDQTLLFNNAGMVPYKQYYLGEEAKHPKVCSIQKCLRAGGKHNDIEEVGFTARHHTFFEMMGNFVFSGASKTVAIQEAWALITEHYGIPKERLWVTVYHEDHESRDIWHRVIGLSMDRIIDCGQADNFWSMGAVGPCGPCTEIFYDYGDSVAGGLPGSDDADGDRYVEIWNLVFMQYEILEDGTQKELSSIGLDTGMGIERLAAVLQSQKNNFDTDIFMPLIHAIQAGIQGIDITACRVMADHIRSAVMLVSDQVYPSNEGRGYVLRRIIRRAISFGYRSGMVQPFFYTLSDSVIELMKEAYPVLFDKRSVIHKVIKEEELKFLGTIKQGMLRLEPYFEKKEDIDGKVAFEMYDTYGFPLDIIKDMAKKTGMHVDEKGFAACMTMQRERSRAHQQFMQQAGIKSRQSSQFLGHDIYSGSASITEIWVENAAVDSATGRAVLIMDQTPFYAEGGGQVGDKGMIVAEHAVFVVEDTQKSSNAILHIGYVQSGQISCGDTVALTVSPDRIQTAGNHSATHLLHAGLRQVLGEHVVQKGSMVNAERLRFDFAHTSPMTDSELMAVEALVNTEIQKNHSRDSVLMPLSEAKQSGVMALFDEKYTDPVHVVGFGDFSKELCGGTHVKTTSAIGLFVLVSETGIASGIRRIEALTGIHAYHHMIKQQVLLKNVTKILKTDTGNVLTKVEQLIKEKKELVKHGEQLEYQFFQKEIKQWVQEASMQGDHHIICQSLQNVSMKTLRSLVESLKSSIEKGLIVLQSADKETVSIIVAQKNTDYQANKILNVLTEQYGGRGGGQPKMAQGKIDRPITINQLKDVIN